MGGMGKLIVPTLCVGMHPKTLRVDYARECVGIALLNPLVYFNATVNRDAERRWMCYHAERGNNVILLRHSASPCNNEKQYGQKSIYHYRTR